MKVCSTCPSPSKCKAAGKCMKKSKYGGAAPRKKAAAKPKAYGGAMMAKKSAAKPKMGYGGMAKKKK